MPQQIVEFSHFKFDIETLELFKNGVRIPLSPKPASLLCALINSSPNIVTRDEAQRILWGDMPYVEPEQNLNACIRQLRVALNDNASSPHYIETLPKRGYRFIALSQKSGERTQPPRKKMNILATLASCVGLGGIILTVLWMLLNTDNWNAAYEVDERAADTLMRASALADRGQQNDVETALTLYNQVLERYPASPSALASKALVLTKLAGQDGYPRTETFSLAAEFANAADAVEPSPQAATAFGFAKLYGSFDPKAALTAFDKAIKRQPSYAEGFLGRAAALAALGRLEDSVKAATTASRLDPRSYSAKSDLCWYLLFSDRRKEAKEACEWAQTIDADHTYSHLGAALAAEKGAEFERSFKEYLSLREFAFNPGDVSETGVTCNPAFTAAQRITAGTVSPYEIASLYAICGDRNNAEIWLLKSAEAHTPSLLFYEFDPRFKNLRDQLPTKDALLALTSSN